VKGKKQAEWGKGRDENLLRLKRTPREVPKLKGDCSPFSADILTKLEKGFSLRGRKKEGDWRKETLSQQNGSSSALGEGPQRLIQGGE